MSAFGGGTNILVTNNPMASELFESTLQVEYLSASLLDVLVRVRNLVHSGHTLLTHPLSGSVKPNETHYKSVLLSKSRGKADAQSVQIIGECILAAQRFNARQLPARYLRDMQIVDLSIISSALETKKTNS
ncbi:MAG: GrdX family protein [Oscillospiraceae bacterium]|nr:GrdX family protein [Oscillospiraceae bacterium]